MPGPEIGDNVMPFFMANYLPPGLLGLVLAAILVGALVLHVAVELLDVHEGLGPLLSIVATLPLSFLLARWLLGQREAAGTSVHEKGKVPYEQ